MKRSFQFYLKNICLVVLLSAILIMIGWTRINAVSVTELRKSTYTRTEFDFHIAAPNAAQVKAIESNSAVSCVFPYYAYAKAFSSDKEIMLMVSDSMDKLGASVLTEDTLIEGSFDADGAMLDKTAADKLGVTVGDPISFNLLGKRITKTVAAIYLPSTLAIMEDGIVAVSLSGAIASNQIPSAYGGAFVVASDRNAAASLLSDYIGEGNVALTYEQYIASNYPNKIPGQTDAEYKAECDRRYAAYRKDVLDSVKRGGGQVVDKLEAYAPVKSQVLVEEENTNQRLRLGAIMSIAIFSLYLVAFTVNNRNANDDCVRKEMGVSSKAMILSYSLAAALTALAVAVITGGVVYKMASETYFLSECMFIILSTALPVLAGVPIVMIVSVIYVKKLYKNYASDTKGAEGAEVPANGATPAQMTESAEPMEKQEPAEDQQPVNNNQPVDNSQPVNNAQFVRNGQPVNGQMMRTQQTMVIQKTDGNRQITVIKQTTVTNPNNHQIVIERVNTTDSEE